MTRASALAFCLVLFAAATSAGADNDAVIITFENDSYTGYDGSYSSGLGITYASGEAGTYDPGDRVRRWVSAWSFLPFVGDDGYRNYTSWTLGLEIYTPSDITDPQPPADDQPYAGILYLDNIFHARKGRWGHTWDLRAGYVGPAVHGEEMQKWAHKVVDSDEPRGWDAQLPNEPILNLNYSAAYLWRTGDAGETAQWRVVPMAGFGVGNYFTGLTLGLYGEIGWNLADVLGLPTLRNGFSAAHAFGAAPQDNWSVSFFAGGVGNAVAHFLPLDGTVFRDSRSVGAEPFIGAFTGGIAIRHRTLVVTLAHTKLTETFDTERRTAQYGTFNFSWYF